MNKIQDYVNTELTYNILIAEALNKTVLLPDSCVETDKISSWMLLQH